MKELYKKFKNLTGFTYTDIAETVGVSRQHIAASMGNHSLVYRASMATVMNYCVDIKINSLEKQIEELKALRKDIVTKAIENCNEVQEG